MSLSKSQQPRKPKRMLSSGLPSFWGEKGAVWEAERPRFPVIDLRPTTPGSEATGSSVTLRLDAAGGSQSDDAPKLERRKPRLGLLGFFVPTLTSSQSLSDRSSSLVREATLASPSPSVADFSAPPSGEHQQHHFYGHRASSMSVDALVATSNDTNLSPRLLPNMSAIDQRRKSSFPSMLRKLQRSAPELVLPVSSFPATGLTSPQKTLKKTRNVARSSSVDRTPASPTGSLQSDRSGPHHMKRRSISAQPPSRRGLSDELQGGVHAQWKASIPENLRPESGQSNEGTESTRQGRKRRSWLPGGSSRNTSQSKDGKAGATAWVLAPDNQAEYNTLALTSGEKVPELWNDNGTVSVYLFPMDDGRGPSFKVADEIFTSSEPLTGLMLGDMIARLAERESGDRSGSPPARADGKIESHLYLPLGSRRDLDRLVSARNLFAFLTGQALVGTRSQRTYLDVFMQISALLREFNFNSFDDSSFGEMVEKSLDSCSEQLGLADVRGSGGKTLQALVLGEQMRSWSLYNEGFCHAVGRYEELMQLKSPLYGSISASTRNRLERAHLDLIGRQANVYQRLEAFEFPSLFAGTAISTSTSEYRTVRFKEWRGSFARMRAFVLSYYKDLFGNWPPKARSKKNRFSQSGLNRQCLQILYADFCALYDLLVDRESPTSRYPRDRAPSQVGSTDGADGEEAMDPNISALRRLLGEFDKSSPPILPSIPFNVPLIPTITSIRENYQDLPSKKQAKIDKSLQAHELALILIKSHNMDADDPNSPFLAAFSEFETREWRSGLSQDLADQRFGHWLFLCVVLQSLPMLVVDAPDLVYTEGVEYFLCEPPQGNLPWMEDAGEVRKVWFQTVDRGLVELSADVVMFSVEATYMRSHCWLAAKAWEAARTGETHPQQSSNSNFAPAAPLDLLEAPRRIFQDMDPRGVGGAAGIPASAPSSPILCPRNVSPSARLSVMAGHAWRSSIAIGLEPLAVPDSAVLAGVRRTSRVVSASSRPSSYVGSRARPGIARSQVASPISLSQNRAIPTTRTASSPWTTSRTSFNGDATFDDILKGIQPEKKKTKSRFGF